MNVARPLVGGGDALEDCITGEGTLAAGGMPVQQALAGQWLHKCRARHSEAAAGCESVTDGRQRKGTALHI